MKCWAWTGQSGTDSMDVWYWVRGHSRQFKPFVSNRVGEIQRKTEPAHWGHVRTKLNPADKLTRGLSVADLVADRLWWMGPEFLLLPQEDWPMMEPKERQTDATSERKSGTDRAYACVTINQSGGLLSAINWKELGWGPTSVSDWFRFLRVFAYIVRFLTAARGGHKSVGSAALSVDELNDVEIATLKQMQTACMKDEVVAVRKGQSVAASSKVASMCPTLDADGLLRGNSRLNRVDCVSWNTRYPVLMGRHQRETRLIFKRMHEDCNHAGTNQVLTMFTTKYWMSGAREEA